ncbi:hypothetical protein D5S10_09015 [Pseudomonas savastanoi]|uniref:Uncharacterized protein n=1 Tax=Pseudomonas amygdali pv. tabaci TaxID=322 RepID=A0AAX1VV02_PSEAJ|nr:hypothetical protein A3SK_0108665 [Pseudomonas amygdali pv. tabaci str. 6605]KIY17375.1 hypothetical protein RD00_15270 [Pseudomonas amygdali pv. tabaci]QOI04003.1 hypothetical protein D5S10_09015 [Pseudomonas savastanoi]RMP73622.1 hypothetical protein ALQ17_100641 [Pseudomonas fluorescens]KPY83060.1 Uncharacterized protein ALO60_02474 [Pseudomonas amygdali pv. tabaci]
MRITTVSASETEERISSIICEHFLSGTQEKLTVSLVSERAGISRQAFHKKYLHLKPYLTGQRRVDELFLRQSVDPIKVILQTQNLVRDLQGQLHEARSNQAAEFEEFENNVLTSLMASDILTHRAKELTAELRKKALHVEMLKRQLSEKEVELALQASDSTVSLPAAFAKNPDLHVFKPDLAAALAGFLSNSEKETYGALKRKAIDAMQHRVLKILKQGTIRVVVFQERYLCSFEKFVDRYFSRTTSSLVVLNLPLSSRLETQEFLRALKGAVPLELYVPHCDSEAVVKAQRAFLFGNIPDFELKATDREPLPTIHDGYDRVTVFRIEQGE